MFPIKSLRKPLVTGALLFPHKRKAMRFAQSPERAGGLGGCCPVCQGRRQLGCGTSAEAPLPRNPTQQGVVGNLSNLPETEKIAPKRGCACATEKGTFVATFLGQVGLVPPSLWNRPPERSDFKMCGFFRLFIYFSVLAKVTFLGMTGFSRSSCLASDSSSRFPERSSVGLWAAS